MNQLVDRPDLMGDETLHGYASRTARCYGTELSVLCSDLGLSLRGLVGGRAAPVDRFAELTGLDAQTLTRHAFLPRGGLWFHKEQILHRLGVRRIILRVCPACLDEDTNGSALAPDEAAYVRAQWLVKSVRACVKHDVGLVRVPDADGLRGDGYHDLAKRLASTACELGPLLRSMQVRKATRLEAYLGDRLHGTPTDGGFADGMPLYAAARSSEMLGAAALFGPKTLVRSLEPEDWRAAGEVGFDVLARGPEAIVSCLTGLMENHGVANRNTGANKVYGLLHRWLSTRDSGPDYEPFRALLREVIFETIPLPAGSDVLGVELDKRRIHSLHSVAAETGRGLKGLRRELRAAGVLPFVDGKGPGRLVAIPVDKSAAAIEDLAASLPRKGAAERVNASVADLRRLVLAGLLKPIVPNPDTSGSHVRFSIRVLDRFIADLYGGVTGITLTNSDLREIPLAAKSLGQTLVDVTGLVIGRKLSRVVRRPGESGFRSVLVDRVELSALTWDEEDRAVGLRTADVAERLHISVAATGALVRAGHLATRMVEVSNGRPVKVFTENALRRFAAEYESLAEAAGRHGMHSKTMLKLLDERKVVPAFPTAKRQCFFYRRSDVRAAMTSP